jgi:tripeptide aminopeptidase
MAGRKTSFLEVGIRSAAGDLEVSSRLVSLFRRLAAIPSPTGDEGRCAEAVAAELEAMGLRPIRDGAGAAVGSSGDNLYCRIPPTTSGVPLFFCAHLDTVPPTARLDPVVVDGVIRNAAPSIVGADNKAAVAVMLDAAATIVRERVTHAGVELVFTIGEEHGLVGSTAFDSSVLRARGGYVAAAPSRFVVKATMHGRAAHSAIAPQDGVNAIVPMARAIASLPEPPRHVNVNVALVHGGSAMNVVPESSDVTVDVRSTEHDDAKVAAERIGEALQTAAAQGGCRLDVEISEPYSAYRVPADSPALALAKTAFAKLGLECTPVETRGGSDANVFCKRGLDCVNLTHAVIGFHAPDERVAVADLALMRTVTLEIVAAAADGSARA